MDNVEIDFVDGPKVEIVGKTKKEYFVEFIDSSINKVIHSGTIKTGHWIKPAPKYYIPWIIKINGEEIYKLDLKNQLVRVIIDSPCLGDTIGWTPQLKKFQEKHNCFLIVSTYYNHFFENLPYYKNIQFVEPSRQTPEKIRYKLGYIRNEQNKWSNEYHPIQVNTQPLIKAACDILGMDFEEIQAPINFSMQERKIKNKYICIGPQSTMAAKEWPRENWKILTKKLKKSGYEVVSLSKNGFDCKHVINKTNLNWDDLCNYLYHAEFLIGLGSGLSWLNWALNKHTFMIANFSKKGHEFTKNITQIENLNVCNGCWVDPKYVFDKGDWDWCPRHRHTDKQHICQKSITATQVYKTITKYLKNGS